MPRPIGDLEPRTSLMPRWWHFQWAVRIGLTTHGTNCQLFWSGQFGMSVSFPDTKLRANGSHQPQLHRSRVTIAENQPVGTIVGEFNATAPDAGASLTYHLSAGQEIPWSSSPSRPTVRSMLPRAAFDYESNASTYSISVQAKDEFNATVEGNPR